MANALQELPLASDATFETDGSFVWPSCQGRTVNRLPASRFISRRTATIAGRYGLAAASVGAGLAGALLLQQHNLPRPFTAFSFLAMAISFWFAGTGPGLLALVLSYSIFTILFAPVTGGRPVEE